MHALAGTPYISQNGADVGGFDAGKRAFVLLEADKNVAAPGNGSKREYTVHAMTLLTITESNGYRADCGNGRRRLETDHAGFPFWCERAALDFFSRRTADSLKSRIAASRYACDGSVNAMRTFTSGRVGCDPLKLPLPKKPLSSIFDLYSLQNQQNPESTHHSSCYSPGMELTNANSPGQQYAMPSGRAEIAPKFPKNINLTVRTWELQQTKDICPQKSAKNTPKNTPIFTAQTTNKTPIFIFLAPPVSQARQTPSTAPQKHMHTANRNPGLNSNLPLPLDAALTYVKGAGPCPAAAMQARGIETVEDPPPPPPPPLHYLPLPLRRPQQSQADLPTRPRANWPTSPPK